MRLLRNFRLINVISKSWVLLQIGAADQTHCTRGSDVAMCTQHPDISKSSVQVLCYHFPLKSLGRLILKDKWWCEALFPSLCGAWHPSRQHLKASHKLQTEENIFSLWPATCF
jgi:hypothetical protein